MGYIISNVVGDINISGNQASVPLFRKSACPAACRWGCTLLAYKPDRLVHYGGRPILDWPDLLQPRLKGRIAFLDSSRELVGVALKILGLPYNATAAECAKSGVGAAQLRRQVQELRSHVRLFSNRDHVRAFTAGAGRRPPGHWGIERQPPCPLQAFGK